MKLKYYMRGLGIGIVVTAIFMSIFGKGQIQELTDSEIRERAKAIGMIEDTVLADMSEKNLDKIEDEKKASEEDSSNAAEVTPEETPADAVEGAKAAPEITGEETEKETTEGVQDTAEVAPADTPKDASEGSKDFGNTAMQGTSSESKIPTDNVANVSKTETPIIIIVKGGDSSFSVSRKLAEAGLVESAGEYDSYLCQNGYDKKITSGSHSIPPNTTPEEIAKIITKSR